MSKNFEKFVTLLPAAGNGAKVFDTDYLDEIKETLLGKIVLEGKTIDYAHLIPGVKNRIALNELTGVGQVVDATCGWPSTPGSIVLNQRELIVYPKEIKDSICTKTLETTYLGTFMKSNKEVPFIEVIANQYVNTAKAFVETFIWQGDGVSDGLYQILDADTEVVDASVAVGAAANWIAKVNALVAAATPELLSSEDGVIVMDYPSFVAYQQELIAANLFSYPANTGSDMTLFVPGTRIKVRATTGLNGIAAPTTGDPIIYTYEQNIAVGTDMLNDEEIFDIWYSRDNDEVRVNVQFKIGANVYFPTEVVKGYAI